MADKVDKKDTHQDEPTDEMVHEHELDNVDNAPEEPAADDDAQTAESSEPDDKPVHEIEQTQVEQSDGKVLPPAPSHDRGRFKRLGDWFAIHKKSSIFLGIVLVLAILGAVPWTRYKVVGLVWKQQFQVTVLDSQTHLAVSSANVHLAGHAAVSNNKGQATFKVKPGSATLQADKKYYVSASSKVMVPIFKQKSPYTLYVRATGRQVPIVITNKISGKPIANAQVQAADTEAKTDSNGKVTMVLPADKQKIDATISASGYNDAKATITVTTTVDKANTFTITPAGKVYFLSNLSGKLDVVKTNLDGTSRQTVLAGTGFESTRDTSLLASRDWKYLVLKAVRDNSGTPKMLIINTSNDKVTTFDEGTNVGFNLIGWYGHSFYYWVSRNTVNAWENNAEAVKGYNADSSHLSVLDQTQGEGEQGNYAGQVLGNFYILPGQLVYSSFWNAYPLSGNTHMSGKSDSIRAINLSNQSKKDYKTFDPQTTSYIEARAYEPASVYYAIHPSSTGDTTYYEFEDNALKPAANVSAETFNQGYPTYLLSPSGDHTFWSDARDGKNTLFVGDKDAKNQKQIASLSDYQTYGWYSDNYLLVSKQGSELYAMPVSGGTPLKITDYYKPAVTYAGYGYGYGGL